jgi:hypothetical protein
MTHDLTPEEYAVIEAMTEDEYARWRAAQAESDEQDHTGSQREKEELIDEPFCSACSEPVAKRGDRWVHLDDEIGATCAAERGDDLIIPLAGRELYTARPYRPWLTLRALEGR